MGLLDALFSGSQDGGGGLLDFLRTNANQQFSSGLPSDQAQYGRQPMNAMAQAPPMFAQQSPQSNAAIMQAPQQQPQPLAPQPQLVPPAQSNAMVGLQSFGNTQGPLLGRIANGIAGFSSGQRADPAGQATAIQQQTMSARFNALKEAGYTPKEAMVGAMDQKAFDAMAPQAFGGEPPKTMDYEGANGIKSKMQYDDKTRQWSIINPAGAPPAAAPGQFGSAPSYPPAPPGVNVPKYNEATAGKAADELANIQAKAEGARDALKVLTRLKERAMAAHPGAYGPLSGSDYGQTINSVSGAILPGDQQVASQQSELQGLYNDAGSSMLKARYGARITNVDVHQGMKIVGGLTQPNQETALKTINNNITEAYDTLAEGIKRGVVNPQEVLQRATTAQQAKALGPGALYIAPDGSIRRNPH